MKLKIFDTLIFNRGYLAIEFIDFSESEGNHYLFHLSSNDYIAKRKRMRLNNEIVLKKTLHNVLFNT